MPCAVFRVRALIEQELFHGRRAAKYELIIARCLQDALLNHAQLDLQDLLQMRLFQRPEDHDLVNAVHELRRELPPRSLDRRATHLLIQPIVFARLRRAEPKTAGDHVVHLRGAQVRGHHDQALRKIHAPVVAQGQRRLIENAQQQLPQRVARLLDLVEKQQRQLQLLRVELVQRLLRQQRMRLSMSQISRRRSDQLGDLMAVLKLRAIDLDASACIAKQRLRHGLHDARLAAARRSQKQQIAHRSPRRIQSG